MERAEFHYISLFTVCFVAGKTLICRSFVISGEVVWTVTMRNTVNIYKRFFHMVRGKGRNIDTLLVLLWIESKLRWSKGHCLESRKGIEKMAVGKKEQRIARTFYCAFDSIEEESKQKVLFRLNKITVQKLTTVITKRYKVKF